MFFNGDVFCAKQVVETLFKNVTFCFNKMNYPVNLNIMCLLYSGYLFLEGSFFKKQMEQPLNPYHQTSV